MISRKQRECIKSPIEALFYAALVEACDARQIPIYSCDPDKLSDDNPNLLNISTQHPCLGKRFDFMLGMINSPDRKALFVECDGFEYHNTRDAFIEDRRYDGEVLAQYGIPVMRFSGSELHRHADDCAVRALMALGFMK